MIVISSALGEPNEVMIKGVKKTKMRANLKPRILLFRQKKINKQ
jgi:hypothetical protein